MLTQSVHPVAPCLWNTQNTTFVGAACPLELARFNWRFFARLKANVIYNVPTGALRAPGTATKKGPGLVTFIWFTIYQISTKTDGYDETFMTVTKWKRQWSHPRKLNVAEEEGGGNHTLGFWHRRREKNNDLSWNNRNTVTGKLQNKSDVRGGELQKKVIHSTLQRRCTQKRAFNTDRQQ